MENKTLTGKIALHPKLWAAAAALAAMACIVSGALGLVIRTEVVIKELADAPHYGHVSCQAVGRDKDADFELRNTFCRFIPTGKEYYCRVQTAEGVSVYLRTDKDFGEKLPVNAEGRAARFSKREQAQLRENLALDDVYFIDTISDRLYLLRILAGVLLLADVVLGALMIKDKISAESSIYKTANIVFCTLPVAALLLGIHLMGFV
ncbi:hypothetical protein [Ruminococcus albus]|uniref:Putative lipoprotein n=1 Tax=Ruminococcus albus 8 TaxID=246199 RepID=E9S943_RUMAL|nr:hypothetical protein [Ruminococcus albus]EGC04239.1 putative lipoprotein [Ruminococcus albus 8]MCC3350935.1 hypothetical protein [Ruminococcus albus 8]